MDNVEVVQEILSHHGVMGMRWGHRKSGGGTSIMHPPSADAAAAKSASEKAKKSGLDSLSNKEIQVMVSRMNLEQQVSKLNPSTVKRGHNTVNVILASGVAANSAIALAKSPAGQLIKIALMKSPPGKKVAKGLAALKVLKK